MPRLNLDVDSNVFEQFKENCKLKGRTMSDMVRQLIDEWNSAVQYEEYVRKVVNGSKRDS